MRNTRTQEIYKEISRENNEARLRELGITDEMKELIERSMMYRLVLDTEQEKE